MSLSKTDTDKKMEIIDGSHGEGGGQIIRTSVALSALTGTPVKMVDIRSKRSKPGLRPQHLEGIRALSKICNAKVGGLKVGSEEVTFYPGHIDGGRFSVDIGTAGSISLLIHTILLPSLWATKETYLKIVGGTDVKWSPTIEYTHFTQLSMLKIMGAKVNLGLINRGYYPKGGGEVDLRICPLGPEGLSPLILKTQEGEAKIFGSIHTSGLDDKVGKRLVDTARKNLIGVKSVRIMRDQWDALNPGAGITLVAEFLNTLLGSCSVGEKGKRAQIVAKEAVDELLCEKRSGATMDKHLADQILPFLAVAKGPSEFLVKELTEHTRTNMWVIKRFLGTKFEVDREGGLERIRVRPTKDIPLPPLLDAIGSNS